MKQCEHIEEINRHDLYFYWPDGTEAGYLCEDCARQSGFCPLCGSFVGGVEADMLSMHEHGVCYECASFIEGEMAGYDDEQ